MSTHATEALAHASQGGVARGAQVQGKRVQQAELGKIASAGFAQILGEQVSKSTPQSETGENANVRSTAHGVPTSSPHAPTQALPQSQPHTAPQPALNASEKTAPQVRAQVHGERAPETSAAATSVLPERPRQGASADHHETAQRVRPETTEQLADAVPPNRVSALFRKGASPGVVASQDGEAARTVGQTTQPKAQPITQPIAQPNGIDKRSSLSTAGPDSSAPNAQQAKPTPAANPATRVGEAVYKFAGHPENPAKHTLAPTFETRSSPPTQTQVAQNKAAAENLRVPVSTPNPTGTTLPTHAAHDQIEDSIATPTKAQETERVAQLAARHVDPAAPPPVVMTEASQAFHASTREGHDVAREFTAPQPTVKLDHAPFPGPTSTPIREQTPAQIPAANRVPTKANEAVATLPAKADPSTVHTPVQTIAAAVHVQPAASDNSHRMSTQAPKAATPAAPKTGQSTVRATVQTHPTAAPAHSTASEDTTRSPAPAPSLPVDQTGARPKHAAAPTSPDKGIGISSPTASSERGPVSEPTAIPSPVRTSEKPFAVEPAPHQARPVAPSLAAKPTDISKDSASVVVAPQAQELPRPNPATAPRTMAPASQQHTPPHVAPEPPAHDQKENASIQSDAHTGKHTVVEASPLQEHQPEKRPDNIQAPAVAQAPSLSMPQPSPATVAQVSSAPHVARNPEPASQTPTASPAAAAKTSTRAGIERPAKDHPGILEEPKPAESTTDVKTPEPNANHGVTTNENTSHASADRPAPTSLKHTAAAPEPASGHAGSQSAVRVDPMASKRRARVEDEKKQEEPSADTAKPPQTNLQFSKTSPNEGMEGKVPKPEAPKPAEHRISTETSSQTSSAQPPASQSHPVKEASVPVVLPTGERATVFVSPNTFLPASNEAGGREAPSPSSAAVETAGLVDRAVEDPGLSVNVMPHAAHLSIAGDAGDLSLHVRVRDGSADVNVSGSMAPLFDTKAPEMRTALAGEGLQLGSFATDQRGGSQGQQAQPESTPRTNDPYSPPAQRRPTTSTPEVQITADRRIHVTA